MNKKYVEQRKAEITATRAHAEQLRDGNNMIISIVYSQAPSIETYNFMRDYCELRIRALSTAAMPTGSETK